MTSLTNGEKWLAAETKKLAGYCRARGWRCSDVPRTIGGTGTHLQYEVAVWDHAGKCAFVAFEIIDPPRARLVDDYGVYGDDLSADSFDAYMQPFELAPRPRKNKKQLEMSF